MIKEILGVIQKYTENKYEKKKKGCRKRYVKRGRRAKPYD